MLRLCRKDFIASRWFWLLALIVYLLYGVFSINQDLAFMAMAIVFILGLVALPLIIEDHCRTEIFFCSLPVDRSTIVGSRYLLSGLMVLFGGLLVYGYKHFLNSVVRIHAPGINAHPLLTLEGLSEFVTLAVFLICLFYPLYFRFGLSKAVIWLTIILLAFLVADNGIGSLTSSGFDLRGLLRLHSLVKVKDFLGPLLFLLCAVALNLGIVFFSIRLSIRFYDQRDF